jgi:predicted ArsR family transcriptional regulator
MPQTMTSGDLRVHNQVRLLRAVHDAAEPFTRAEAARLLGIGRNTAAALVGELEAARLLHEVPAESGARGRPTTMLVPHPQGPLAFAVDFREDSWTLAAVELGGSITELETAEHDRTPRVFADIRAAVARHESERLAVIGFATSGPIRDGQDRKSVV